MNWAEDLLHGLEGRTGEVAENMGVLGEVAQEGRLCVSGRVGVHGASEEMQRGAGWRF